MDKERASFDRPEEKHSDHYVSRYGGLLPQQVEEGLLNTNGRWINTNTGHC